MINVSNSAKEKLLEFMSNSDNKNKKYVRVGVKSGGCSGLSYVLDFDFEMNENDKLIEDNGIKLIVEKKSYL